MPSLFFFIFFVTKIDAVQGEEDFLLEEVDAAPHDVSFLELVDLSDELSLLREELAVAAIAEAGALSIRSKKGRGREFSARAPIGGIA